ncbi:MAG: DUF3488 and transglutaminase-like domain-containing protein [Actinomycetota bacterium]|nr:DUF3488 and transglutaminase-like domain-containing protein [Actinomycetota bacterium]
MTVAPGTRTWPEELEIDDMRRTALVGLGALLGVAPLWVIFDDSQWVVEAVGAALCVLVPALALRARSVPRAVQLVPGLAVLIGYATALYVHGVAVAGFIPGPGAWNRIRELQSIASTQIAENTTPLGSTHELRLFVVPAIGAFVAIVDWYAVVRRAPALAGIPLLAVYTVCGAISGRPIGWLPFALSAAGFLVILSANSRVILRSWGRVVPRRQGDRVARPRLGLSGRRIGVIAVVIAVVVPSLLPGLSRNLLAEAFQSGSGGATGQGRTLSPFASLKGELARGDSIALFDVQVDGTDRPFYLRTKVLDEFSPIGWRQSQGFRGSSVSAQALAGAAPAGGTTRQFTAHFDIRALKDAAPMFATASGLPGLGERWRFSSTDGTLGSTTTSRGEQYTEIVSAPEPTATELRQAVLAPDSLPSKWLDLPAVLPTFVRDRVATLTRGLANPYERAIALSGYFTDPANQFHYSLQTQKGDSGNDLVDFLQSRTGYCQQYAAALAVMLRVAKIPARVVLGYTHGAPDARGRFTVTSHDAHAWVEGYFTGIGWQSFDPTPLAGADAGRAVAVPGVPRATNRAGPTTGSSGSEASQVPSRNNPNTLEHPSDAALAGGGGSGGSGPPSWLWPVLALLAVGVAGLSVLPASRLLARRARFRSALRTGRVEPLWQELRAAAEDTGTAWSVATTPRQVPRWLTDNGISATTGVRTLAAEVERERYAPAASAAAGGTSRISDGIQRVRVASRSMREQRNRRRRLQARLLPASVIAAARDRLTSSSADATDS